MRRHALLSWTVLRMAMVVPVLHSSVLYAAKPPVLKEEVQEAIGTGLAWLTKNQDVKTGAWGNPEQPALTAMAVLAFLGDPKVEKHAAPPESVRKAYAFIRTHAKADGGIYGKGLAVYNTALCLSSLLLDDDGQSRALTPGAKRFLDHHRSGFELRVESGDAAESVSGGSVSLESLSNALESFRQSEEATKDSAPGGNGPDDLDFEAARKFLQQSQKPSAGAAVETKAASDEDRGGGAGRPAKAPGADGRVALRASGEMTYDGLLSLIYAPMGSDDPRLDAFLGWLQENYSIEENPGLGRQGLFYYYHSIAKVLSIRKIDRLKLKNGTEVDWRRDLARKILAAQQKDGSWVNRNGRWWENDPFLVSSYALLTLEQIARGL